MTTTLPGTAGVSAETLRKRLARAAASEAKATEEAERTQARHTEKAGRRPRTAAMSPGRVKKFRWLDDLLDAELGLPATHVGMLLAKFADEDSGTNIFPSIERAAEDSAVSLSTLNRGLKELVRLDLLERVGYHNRNAEYRLLPFPSVLPGHIAGHMPGQTPDVSGGRSARHTNNQRSTRDQPDEESVDYPDEQPLAASALNKGDPAEVHEGRHIEIVDFIRVDEYELLDQGDRGGMRFGGAGRAAAERKAQRVEAQEELGRSRQRYRGGNRD